MALSLGSLLAPYGAPACLTALHVSVSTLMTRTLLRHLCNFNIVVRCEGLVRATEHSRKVERVQGAAVLVFWSDGCGTLTPLFVQWRHWTLVIEPSERGKAKCRGFTLVAQRRYDVTLAIANAYDTMLAQG